MAEPAPPATALPATALPDGVREAVPGDVPDILRLIRALADYEREPDAVATTEEDLRRWVFGPDAAARVLVAETAGRVVGMALWFRTYSTWTCVPGNSPDDQVFKPDQRGSGLCRALLTSRARIAVARGYQRVEWAVLDWNEPSIAFYEALGARPMQEWTTYRLTGDALAALGGA